MALATRNKIEIIKAVQDVAHHVRDYHHDNEVRRPTYAPHSGYDVNNYPAETWTYEAFAQFTRKVTLVAGMGLNVEAIIASPQLVGIEECKDWVEANVDFYAVALEKEVLAREELTRECIFSAGTMAECRAFVASVFANLMISSGDDQLIRRYYTYQCEDMRLVEAISLYVTH